MKITNNQYPTTNNKSQSGQVVIILLLIMLVGLVLAISVTQKSVNDLAVSTQTEDATRAFSAAEAGIERALSDNSATSYTINSQVTGNDSQATVQVAADLPRAGAGPGGLGQADEEPVGINRSTIAQFWLANPRMNLAPTYPNDQRIDVYYGDPTVQDSSNDQRMPAIEIYIIGKNNISGDYVRSTPYLFDSVGSRATGVNGNNFQTSGIQCNGGNTGPTYWGFQINTDNSPNTTIQDRNFRCMVQIDLSKANSTSPNPIFTGIAGMTPIMLRIRVLYSDNQPIAVAPGCLSIPAGGCNLPPQKTVYTSTGRSGQSIKTVQETRKDDYFLPFFDFAIFSISDITK